MTVLVRLERQTELGAVPAGVLDQRPCVGSRETRDDLRAELSIEQLAFRVFAAFRTHPHINNVLTHISRANWLNLEQSLQHLLDPATTSDGLSPLEHNILDLMCADRGITGRILKPYFRAVLHSILEPGHAECVIRHGQRLFHEVERKSRSDRPPRA